MDPKKNWNELLDWGNKDEEHRKRAISAATKYIALINHSSGKKISKEELNKVIGGKGFGMSCHCLG